MATTQTIQEGVIGLQINIPLVDPGNSSLPLNLTNASSITFVFSLTGETTIRLTKAGTINTPATAGIVSYILDNDLNLPGTWKFQIIVVMNNGDTLYSEVSKIKVKANI